MKAESWFARTGTTTMTTPTNTSTKPPRNQSGSDEPADAALDKLVRRKDRADTRAPRRRRTAEECDATAKTGQRRPETRIPKRDFHSIRIRLSRDQCRYERVHVAKPLGESKAIDSNVNTATSAATTVHDEFGIEAKTILGQRQGRGQICATVFALDTSSGLIGIGLPTGRAA